MYSIEELKKMLTGENYTCVISCGESIAASSARGIRPLIEFAESGKDFGGGTAADKIVGKASALVYAYMGVKILHACVASRAAVEVCRTYGIELTYDTLTERIVNRTGDDVCPMEKTVLSIDDPAEAIKALKATLARLANK